MKSRTAWSFAAGWLLIATGAFGASAGCSSTATSNTSSPQASNDAGSGGGGDEKAPEPAASEEDSGPAAPQCDAPPTKSKCGNEGGWVQGTVHFDGTKFKAGSKPILRVTLRHKFALVPGEEKIGGRLHAIADFPIKTPETGELKFAIDMCGFETAMWSEENDLFHLVLSIDENNNNDVSTATTNEEAVTVATPDPDELAGMVEVDVSCHKPASCVDVKLDCKGTSCLTFKPITKCTKKTPGCKSDDSFCN